VNISSVDSFYYQDGSTGKQYSIGRTEGETDEKTYMNGSSIYYVYVSGDVTLTRAAKTIKEEYEGNTQTTNFADFNLSLKKGWNLIQTDESFTSNDSGKTVAGSKSVNIASNDVPWSVEIYSGGN
jgi:hypothetical protein